MLCSLVSCLYVCMYVCLGEVSEVLELELQTGVGHHEVVGN